MSQHQGGGNVGNKGISHMQKREILWNIIEPGDPYDIKKYHQI